MFALPHPVPGASRFILARAIAALFGLAGVAAQAADAPYEFLVVGKERWHRQTDASTLVEGEDPYAAFTFIEPAQAGYLQSATLVRPGGASTALVQDEESGEWFYDSPGYLTLATLNQAWPNGSYRFELGTSAGAVSHTLSLEGDQYPAAVRLINYAEAQAIAPDQPFTLRWEAFAGAGPQDWVRLEMEPYPTDSDTELLVEEMLPGDTTSFTLPAGTLQSGRRYQFTIDLVKVGQTLPTDVAQFGAAFYVTGTEVVIKAAGTATGPELVRVVFQFIQGRHDLRRVDGTHVAGQARSGQTLRWAAQAMVVDTSFPEPSEVSLTGPVGSGYQAAPGSRFPWNWGDSQGAAYGFPQRTEPALPWEGSYTLRYRNVDYPVDLGFGGMAPDEHFALPQFTLDAGGNISAYEVRFIEPGSGQAMTAPSVDYLHLHFAHNDPSQARSFPLEGESLSGTLPGAPVHLADHAVVILNYGLSHTGHFFSSEWDVAPAGVPWGNVFDTGVYRWTPWLGFFYDALYPWVFQEQVGWFYCAGASEQDLWLWHHPRGWLWTSSTQFPFLFSQAQAAWVWLNTAETPSVWYLQGQGGYTVWP